MAAELVETSQLFARTVAKLDPAWLEKAAGPLCRRSYGAPHWEQKPAQVMCKEHVTLYEAADHQGPLGPVRALTTRPSAGRCSSRTHSCAASTRPRARSWRTTSACTTRWRACATRRERATCSPTSTSWPSSSSGASRRACTAARRSRRGAPASSCRSEGARAIPRRLAPRPSRRALARTLSRSTRRPRRHATAVLRGRSERGRRRHHGDRAARAVAATSIPTCSRGRSRAARGQGRRALCASLRKSQRKALGAPVDTVAVELASVLRPFDGPMLPTVERAIYERTRERIPRRGLGSTRAAGVLELHVSRRRRARQGDRDEPRPRRAPARARPAREAGVGGRAAQALRTLGPQDLDDRRPAGLDRDRRRGRRIHAYPALVDAESAVDVRLLGRRPRRPKRRAMGCAGCSCSSCARRWPSSRRRCRGWSRTFRWSRPG